MYRKKNFEYAYITGCYFFKVNTAVVEFVVTMNTGWLTHNHVKCKKNV